MPLDHSLFVIAIACSCVPRQADPDAKCAAIPALAPVPAATMPDADANEPRAEAAHAPDAGENPRARIESFDCSSSSEDKRGETLRSWKNGGPAGATWNWYGHDVICDARVAIPCAGEVFVRFFSGNAAPRTEKVVVTTPGDHGWRFVVPWTEWEPQLRGSDVGPYETLLLRAEIEGVCESHETYLTSDAFLAGFAGGE